MSKARRAIPRRRRSLFLAVSLVAGAAILAAGVAIAQLGSGDEDTPGVASGPRLQQDVGASSAAACAAEIRATEAVLVAARTAAGHWREHVQARTDLLAGKNSEATTKAIWKRTRLAGPSDIAALKAATAAQANADGGCADLPSTETACRQKSAAMDAAAAAGRAATGDWADHLAMMAAHAAGEFGAEHAQDMWVAAWTGAAKNLNAFARADAALANAPPCQLS